MPSITPFASLRSIENSVSSCSDMSVDAYFSDRRYREDSSTDSSQEESSSSLEEQLDESNIPVKRNGYHQSDNLMENSSEEVARSGVSRNIEATETAELQEFAENKEERLNSPLNDEFWLPPEPEDKEDDIVGSIANYDDEDDECGDGTWGRPSSLSSFGEVGNVSHKFKEEKIKAMDDVRNGKFRALVSQLVKSVGVDSSEKYGENWVDIVTSLSWEAAAFVKPDAHEGKAMDPDGYVKVKCIATGSRTQSQLIKGLVFKKHAAHKHMPTEYKNPRLLLIHGSLDLSSDGLASFASMKQEMGNSKSTIVEMIDMYNPNVILVEKSVPREIQEFILAKGITLVFDMKLHRLERVVSCIGSPIMASGDAIGPKLRQCDSFHMEKFVDEHAVYKEGGKKLSKTLMFLEGAPSRLGCTILLMGANSDELKRIKCVVRCAVVMAYHLMLETSFRLDQTAMFSTISPSEVVGLALTEEQPTSFSTNETTFFNQKESDAETDLPLTIDNPISNGLHRIASDDLISSSEGNSALSFDACSPLTFPGITISTSVQKVIDDSFPLSSDSRQSIPDALSFNGINLDGQAEKDIQISTSEEVIDNGDDKTKVICEENDLVNNESLDTENHSDGDEEQIQTKDEINSVLDSESILVLMSKSHASKGVICEQSHFSHIKFYRSFDVPLGKFLQENLLNQRISCKTCGESPESHFYFYAHHNKQLTIQVRHLPARNSLPGETEGKLWMWSRCGRCRLHDGSSKSTKRVLISTAARGLSFGKFLELSFSNHSSFSSLSSCGHSFHKDFLFFFGLGPMVAMFKYSTVVNYSVSLPPQKMEFNSSVKGEFIEKDYDNIYLKGISMFLDIEKSLNELRNRYVGVILDIQGSSKEFSDIVDMLKQEKSQFEIEIQNAIKNGSEDDAVCKQLSLNRVRLGLLLESCIWDQRLDALLSSDFKMVDSDSVDLHAQDQLLDDAIEKISGSQIKLDSSMDADDFLIKEIPIGVSDENGSALHDLLDTLTSEDHLEENSQQDNLDSNHFTRSKSHLSVLSNLEDDHGWMWAPFEDIRRKYMEDLQRGHLPKIESFSSYPTGSMAQKLISDEGSRLHIPLGENDYIVSDYEDELSSIIACALTLLKDAPIATEDQVEDSKVNGPSQSLHQTFSWSTPHWPSFGSMDSDGIRSPPSNSLENLHSSSFDGLDLLDSLVSYGAIHPRVSMGPGKYPGTRKYSVVCVYSSEFRQLRDRCCPSEVGYIASLSRCRNWDAKGGKSKSFFAKTLDDRLIIKEIKRTEFDSFVKFATNYFDYMSQCYELGNQTCLAKILGIYQVVIKATKSKKETRHDLLVMENLSFGRQIARQYDLKGALHARLNTAGNGSGDVLLDQNFVNDMNVSPLYVSRKLKRKLQRAVYNDTSFLNSINVMDYSLLVGMDTQRRELVCGIIDYLRQYTWDKQLENWVKSSLVLPKNTLPTIVSPIEYKKRFRKFIDTHFFSVPDHWCSQRSSNPCELCGPTEDNSLLHSTSSK